MTSEGIKWPRHVESRLPTGQASPRLVHAAPRDQCSEARQCGVAGTVTTSQGNSLQLSQTMSEVFRDPRAGHDMLLNTRENETPVCVRCISFYEVWKVVFLGRKIDDPESMFVGYPLWFSPVLSIFHILTH